MNHFQEDSKTLPNHHTALVRLVVAIIVLLVMLVPVSIVLHYSRQTIPRPGAHLPILELLRTDGTQVSIDPSKIPQLFIVFANNDCLYCVEEIALLRESNQEMSKQPIRTIVISLSDPAITASWAKELGPTIEVLTPGENLSLRANRIPLMISSRNGLIFDVIVGRIAANRLLEVRKQMIGRSVQDVQ